MRLLNVYVNKINAAQYIFCSECRFCICFVFVGKASLETEKSWLQQEAERWGLHFNLEGKNVGYKYKVFFMDLK